MKKPFPGVWWVEPARLLAGCYPGDPDPERAQTRLGRLLDAGIRSVICLQQEDERNSENQSFAPYQPALAELAASRELDVRWARFPINDCSVPTRKTMTAILDAIDEALAAERPVYVHCWGGRGRAATVVGCWLVRHGLSGVAALRRIRELRRHSRYLLLQVAPQTVEQREFILNWSEAAGR